ncbi:hypothetical protein HHI36_005784 [Cryptolaemus montrouzieri]|uniref:Uncharacterized protein n=1 Tax=Cryptolaemus montrouzieri TaxID=559131 RepID=A0ABD2NW24_9CUCU
MISKLNSVDSDLNYSSSLDEIKETSWQSMKKFFYNSQRGTCCDRTPRQWIEMCIYYMGYTMFIVCLFFGFLMGCLFVVKSTYPNTPIRTKETLTAAYHPGLGFVPNIVFTKHPIIWYSLDPAEEKSLGEYVQELDKFFITYKRADPKKYVDCKSGKKGNKPCFFDLGDLDDCYVPGYQYSNSSMCFFLKLNKMRDWIPKYYQHELDFQDEMSQSLIDHILASTNRKKVFVECLGENLWDNEHLGKMTYYPQQSFEGYFFPYKGEPDYLPPLVAVKLKQVTTGVVIHIKCTVWAKNVKMRLNHLHMKIFLDNTLPY